MRNKPLVSVIIPTYKRPNMIERAVESVLNQTYDNIEVIVVDDNIPGSNERIETEKKLEKYKNNKKFRYIQLEKNSGGAIARNTGFEQSKGEYVNFLDDDDYFFPNKIELQVNKFLENKEISVVGCYAVIKDENNKIKNYEKVNKRGNVFKEQLISNICTTSLALIKRNIFKKIGGFSNLVSSQEHMLFIKIFNENPNYDYIDDILVVINHHNGARISNNSKRVEGTLQLYEHVQKYFDGLTNKEIVNIKVHHLINISTIYALNNNRKEAIKYWNEALKNNKIINFIILKGLCAIIFGSSYETIVSKMSLIFNSKSKGKIR